MCTVTWQVVPGGYDLLVNRDELRSRPRAEPPALRRIAGREVLAPRDPLGGGTWVAVNDAGVGITLLNGHRPAVRRRGRPVSRGLLVRRLAALASAEEIAGAVAGSDLESFRPFELLALDGSGPGVILRWDGLILSQCPAPPRGGLASSSLEPQRIPDRRLAILWESCGEGSWELGELLAFHRSHAPARGPVSPCMHRRDALTVSQSWIRVRSGEIGMTYTDGPPCTTAAGAPLRLAGGRAAAEAAAPAAAAR